MVLPCAFSFSFMIPRTFITAWRSLSWQMKLYTSKINFEKSYLVPHDEKFATFHVQVLALTWVRSRNRNFSSEKWKTHHWSCWADSCWRCWCSKPFGHSSLHSSSYWSFDYRRKSLKIENFYDIFFSLKKSVKPSKLCFIPNFSENNFQKIL